MTIVTVRGNVPSSQLGSTLPHEHLFVDTSQANVAVQPAADVPLVSENFWRLRLNPYLSRENLSLSDESVIEKEVGYFKRAGGSAIVDLTVEGIGRNPDGLKSISERTGINIVCGCGFYVNAYHPEWVSRMTAKQLAEIMIEEITSGIKASAVRAGVIGELGCREPLHPDERKVLEAAAIAQSGTGAGLSVHPALFDTKEGRVPKKAQVYLEILASKGADMSKVWLSHMDFTARDVAYHRRILEKYSVSIAYDTFGHEYVDPAIPSEPGMSDFERFAAFEELVSMGFEDRLLLSTDIFCKSLLRAYGGSGYSYVLEWVVPLLRRHGVKQSTIDQVTVRNPARLLDVRGTT